MNLSSMPPEGISAGLSETRPIQFSQKTMSGLAIAMCVLGAIFYCYEYYLRVAPSVMSNELKLAFNLSDAAFGNLAACYYYAYTPMQIPVGMMMDKYGPRRILTLACLFCVFGTYLFADTGNVHIAQIGRFLVGFGSAFAYVGVLKISNVWLPGKYFALMAGLATALGMVGAMTGELTMAYMVGSIGWQRTLFYSVIVGLVLTLALWLVLRDSVPEHASAETPAKAQSKTSSVGVLEGLMFMIKSRMMWVNGFIGCLTFLPLSAFGELWAVPFLQAAGFTRGEAAMGSSMILLGFAIGGPCFGLFSDVISSRRIPLVLGSFISALFMFLLIAFPNSSKIWMFTLLFGSGFFASAEILVFAIGNDLNRKEVAATAVAFTNMVVMMGGVFLPPLIGKLLDNSYDLGGSSVGTIQNYTSALMVLPVALVLAGFLSLYLKETHKISR